MNYLHNEKKIVHRDLKPDNIMMTIDHTNRPVYKIIDFGHSCEVTDYKELSVISGWNGGRASISVASTAKG